MTAHAMKDFAERPQVPPHTSRGIHHAHHAALYLLDQLREQGHTCVNIPQAFDQGLLTDDEWCAALDLFRSQQGKRSYRVRSEARIARAHRRGRELAERQGRV